MTDTTDNMDMKLVDKYTDELKAAAINMLTGGVQYTKEVRAKIGDPNSKTISEGMLGLCRLFRDVELSYAPEDNKTKNKTLTQLRQGIATVCKENNMPKLTVKGIKLADADDALMFTEINEKRVMALVPAKTQKTDKGGEGEGEDEQGATDTLDSEYQQAVNEFRKNPCINNKLVLDGIMETMIAAQAKAA